MYRRKGRRRKSTWFPVLGTTYNGDTTSWTPVFERAVCTPNADASVPPATDNTALDCFAVIPDQTAQISAHNSDWTLRDYVEGQDWFLDSIVGRVHVAIANGTEVGDRNQIWPAIMVKAGFFVADAKTDAETEPDNDPTEFDPLAVDCVRNPWIWQRSWLLGVPLWYETGGASAGGMALPTNNSLITGVDAGCVVKTRTKRRIRRNQRIWFVMSCVGYSPATLQVAAPTDSQPTVQAILDLRICGQMRRSRNQSSF